MTHFYPRPRSPSPPPRHLVIDRTPPESSIAMSRSSSYEPYGSSAPPLAHYPATYEPSGYPPPVYPARLDPVEPRLQPRPIASQPYRHPSTELSSSPSIRRTEYTVRSSRPRSNTTYASTSSADYLSPLHAPKVSLSPSPPYNYTVSPTIGRVSSLRSSAADRRRLAPPSPRSSQQALYPSDDFADYASDTGRLHPGRTNLVNMPTSHRRHHSSSKSSSSGRRRRHHRRHRHHDDTGKGRDVDAYDAYIYTTPSEQFENESNAYVRRLSRYHRDGDRRGYYSMQDHGRLREPYTTPLSSSPRESERLEREDRSRWPVHDAAIARDRSSRRSSRLEDGIGNLSLRSRSKYDEVPERGYRESRYLPPPPTYGDVPDYTSKRYSRDYDSHSRRVSRSHDLSNSGESENGPHIDRLSSHSRRTNREPSVSPGRRSSESEERPRRPKVQLVEPGQREKESPAETPPKSILKTPTVRFPEEANPIREGVAPLKDAAPKKGVPPQARWTKINRKLVNPAALAGQERFEERSDCVIVLRQLSKEEVQVYADKTQELRGIKPNPYLNHKKKLY